jgi:DNA adenine methylase
MPKCRTPLRYPGGKQRLAPFLKELLAHNDAKEWNYVEPYAGGAGIAMELLADGWLSHAYLNDSSRHIYAFWRSVLEVPDEFCRRISSAALSVAAWKRHREVVRHPSDHDLLDLGFSTFFLNRCNRSGILTAGVIGGLQQKGRWLIDARFPRNELIKRVEVISALADRISVTNLDAEQFMLNEVNKLPRETLVYCDPPYYERAEGLYLNNYNNGDHARLAAFIQTKLHRQWIVSYNGHPKVISLYKARRKFRYSLHYSAIKSYDGNEIFVFADGLNIPPSSQLPYIARAIAASRCA